MYSIKSHIWNLFSRFEHREDPFKTTGDRGTNQRFHEMLGQDIDENMMPLITSILDNTLVPDTLLDKYIPYVEQMLGITVLSTDLGVRRQIIKNWIPLMTIKGTLPSYQLLLGLLGFWDVDIEDLIFKQGFDSPVTFDDFQRRFDDSGCQGCSYYNLHLSSNLVITPEIYALIQKAIKVVEPINARLRDIVHNQEILDFSIYVSEYGDLIADTTGSGASFTLINGNLILTKSDAQKYIIDNGNLIKNG